MTAPTIAATLTTPCPNWCVDCRIPDPGVIDHYSRTWTGTDWYDSAGWTVQVTQRVTCGPDGNPVEDLAVIDVAGDGTFGSVAEFTRALMQAETLKNQINAGRKQGV